MMAPPGALRSARAPLLCRTLAAHQRTATWSAGEGAYALAPPRLVSPLAQTQQGEKGKPILKCTKCAIF